MTRSSTNRLLLLANTIVFAACAAPVSQPEQTGFLSDYSKLEYREEGKINYGSDRLIEYETFMIDPMTILYERDPDDAVFSDREIEDLKAYAVERIEQRLTEDDGYSVVTQPGPGVARIRIGITEIDDTIGLLNISTYTKITGLGLGGLSAEGEMVDSVTGEQLAAMVRWGSGSRIGRSGYTHTGDAKLAIDKWTRDLRRQLDELHGR